MMAAKDYRYILRRDLMSFIERSFYELNPQTVFLPAPHVEVIATKLEACRLGKIRRLIVSLPPRHLKSHCASVSLPAWILGHDPGAHLICVSYGQELAEKLARERRSIMSSIWYRQLFQTRLGERQVVYDFMTTGSGTCLATSVGGVLTGRGADFILIDDALKPDEALSETRRKAVNEWYDNSLLSRLNDKANGCIAIIQQRLHQDDLVGHVMEQEEWEVVSFPAIAETDEAHLIESPLGQRRFRRAPGDVLHPQRESLGTLKKVRNTAGEYNFLSQYQQTPAPPGGAMIKLKWLAYYDDDLRNARAYIVQSWDTANKAAEINDFSACVTIAVLGRRYYVLDVFRKRLNYPDLKRAVLEQARKWKARTVLIEDKASGTQLIQDLRHDGLHGVKAYEPPPQTDKVMRVHAQTTMFENGDVLLPKRASWLAEYVNELTGFPGAKYDDQVDATVQALDHLRTHDSLATWYRLAEGR